MSASDEDQGDLTFEVEGSAAHPEDGAFVADMVPEVAAMLAWGVLVSRQTVEDEIDTMLVAIRGFWDMEPDQVFKMSRAISARCTELVVHLHRLEGKREWRQIRTMQVNQILSEIDRQFKLASREVELRRQDMFLEGTGGSR